MATNLETLYDFIAQRFRTLGENECKLERLIADADAEGYLAVWDVHRSVYTNALRARGLECRNGIVHYPKDGESFYDPVTTDYVAFKRTAAQVVAAADAPVPSPELVRATGLSRASIPYPNMKRVLADVGIYYIPGLGYWHAPQYTTPEGRIIAKHIRGERAVALYEAFEKRGWPLAGAELERWTSGLVNSRFLTRYAHSNRSIAGIGSGLYVPADRIGELPIPMSGHALTELRAMLDPTKVIADKDNLRLFRIVLLAQRLGWLRARLSRTTKNARRRQTIRVEKWTEEGRRQLERAERRTTDAF